MIARAIRLVRGTFEPHSLKGQQAVEVGTDTATGIFKYFASGAIRQLVDNWTDQTVAGAKTLTGTTTISGSATLSGTNTLSGVTTTSGGLVSTFETTSATTDILTSADSGRTFLCTRSSTTQTFTLPSTVAGLTYTFICGHADGEINLSPAAADKITGLSIAGNDDQDIKNTAATNAVGDVIRIVGDGADGWFVTDQRGTWAVV